MFAINESHVLVSDTAEILYNQTPNKSGVITPKYIVLYPADEYTNTLCLSENSVEKFSTHLYAEKARITQYAPFDTKLWHAGASYYQGHYGMNNFSVGIHLAGDVSMDTVRDIIVVLVEKYNIRDILNASDIAPDRFSPEKGISLDTFKSLVDYGNADAVGRFVVTASDKVEVYHGPSEFFASFDTVTPGENVKVLRYDRTGAWAHVLYDRETDNTKRRGWLHESWLRRL